MPTYEYRCPKGHTFERFHPMSDPGPDACEVCGASPVTDYGRGKRREGKEGESAPSEPKKDGGDKPDKTEKKKPAEA